MAASAASDPLAALAGLEGVPSAVNAARDAVDAVLRDRGRRVVTPEQSAAALLFAARESAALEDDHGQDDRAPGDHGQGDHGPGDHGPGDHGPGDHEQADHGCVDHGTIIGRCWEPQAVRLYTELVGLAGLVRTAPGQVIARTHAVLARGVTDDDDLGRLRPGAGVAERMRALNEQLAGRSAASAIVVGAIAHAELLTVAPFVAGNGIVARAVEHMVLIEAGIDGPAVTVPEAAYRAAGSRYGQALSGYRTGSTGGVRDWLLHVAAAVARGAELSPVKPIRRGG